MKNKSTQLVKGNQSTHLVKGNQSTHLVKGNQSTHLVKGNQSTHLVKGNRSTHLVKGNQSTHLVKGNQSKKPRKDPRAGKIVHKKLAMKRTSIKLRASTEKCVAKRTRDKSTKKPGQASSSQKCVPGPSEKNKSGSKILATCKPKYLIQAKAKEKLNNANKKVAAKNKGIITKANLSRKENVKKKVIEQLNSDEYFDIWAFVSIGKREASLNASMKVNIMFEKHSPLKPGKASVKKVESPVEHLSQSGSTTNKICDKGKSSVESNSIVKSKKTQNDSLKEPSCPKSKKTQNDSVKETSCPKSKKTQNDSLKETTCPKSKKTQNDSLKEPSCPKSKEGETSKQKSFQDPKIISEKLDGKKTACNLKNTLSESRKRKGPGYKTCKDESPAKVPKIEKRNPVKQKKKVAKQQTKKTVPSGHHLCNIIEKSPRQASLVAKAMIAMEQEEDTVDEAAARTQVYDWMEMRSHTRTDLRRIQWFNGLGISIKKKIIKNIDENLQLAKDDEEHLDDVDVSSEDVQSTAASESESIHNTLLRTLHHIGDSRLLKEYRRAQKEDFQGPVDVEKCATPAEKKISSPDPKKTAVVEDKKIDKALEKPTSCPLAKPLPCRVVTPVPQFPAGQRTSNVASFIHNPVPQPVYPQQHIHPQPIKVTPYPNSPGYIYQYTMDRPQNKTYPPSSSPPIIYGVNNSEPANRDYPTPFTFSHLGRLGIDRNVSQYQPTAYSASLHLPIQQIGYSYRTYYPTAIHAIPQQTMPALQAVHPQYPVVRAPVVAGQINQDVGPYQHGYPSYPPLLSMRQTDGCMPPPLAPAHRRPPIVHSGQIRQPSLPNNSFPPMESLRSLNPVEVQPIVNSPAVDFRHHQSNLHKQFATLPSCRPHHPQFLNYPCKSPSNSNYSSTYDELNKPFSLCKKEQEDVPVSSCDVYSKSSICNNECLSLSSGSSRTNSECSDVSDLLHSAHSTMYQIEGMSSMDNMPEYQQTQVSVSCDSSIRNASPPFKISISGHTSFSASYSVSSILDMPSCKVKTEPENKSHAVSQASDLVNVTDQNTLELPYTGRGCSKLVCLASAGSSDEPHSKESSNVPVNHALQKTDAPDQPITSHKIVKTEDESEKSKIEASCIIIDDTEGSSDDEPLAKLMKSKSCDNLESQSTEEVTASSCIKVDTITEPAPSTPSQHSEIKSEETSKQESAGQTKPAPNSSKIKKSTSSKLHNITPKNSALKLHKDRPSHCSPTQPHPAAAAVTGDKSQGDTESKKAAAAKAPPACSPRAKKQAHKMKAQSEWHPTAHVAANTNHGWTWTGEGQMKPIPKVSLGREEPVRIRKCYRSMQHTSGEVVSVRDCVILHSDGDGKIPYVAKVSALWENLNGEMMFSMLWYYQPEHTAAGRDSEDGEQELFASKHREENSVACIDDKCFVLMYNEYCRLEAEGVRLEQGVTLPKWRELMPEVTADDKELCRLPPPANTCADNIWFCRYDYDFRKKIVKKPKHKKSNLRYRTPCKVT